MVHGHAYLALVLRDTSDVVKYVGLLQKVLFIIFASMHFLHFGNLSHWSNRDDLTIWLSNTSVFHISAQNACSLKVVAFQCVCMCMHICACVGIAW